MKTELYKKAVKLRKEGYTYSYILNQIPVAKSTLSLWFHTVHLSKTQTQRLTEKKLAAIKRGGEAKRRQKLERKERIITAARSEIDHLSLRELWLIGTTLYWAEGSKEKSYRGHLVAFSNSDPDMIRVFLRWLDLCLNISPDIVKFSIYIHENYKDQVKYHLDFWQKVVGIRYNIPQKVYFKRHNPSPKRKNVSQDYHGQLNVIVCGSFDLNRKIKGWTEGIIARCPVV